MSNQTISPSAFSDEDEEGALPDEAEDKEENEDNISSLNFNGSSAPSSSSSETSSIPTPSKLSNRLIEPNEILTAPPSTAGLFCSPHSQTVSDGESGVNEGENWQVVNRNGTAKSSLRSSSGRNGIQKLKHGNSHCRVSSDEHHSHAISRSKLNRTATAMTDTETSLDYSESIAPHGAQREWRVNGQHIHQGATMQQPAAMSDVYKRPGIPSADFLLTASASSITQLSTDGSFVANDELIDSYKSFVNTLLSFPLQADNYYRMAMKNAFDTLSDYSKNLGVDGSEFLKHLYAYFILGIKIYQDLKGLGTVLFSNGTMNSGSIPATISTRQNAAIPVRTSPTPTPLGSAMVSPATVQRTANGRLMPQSMMNGSAGISPQMLYRSQHHQTENPLYSRLNHNAQMNMAHSSYPPPPSQPPPELASVPSMNRGEPYYQTQGLVEHQQGIDGGSPKDSTSHWEPQFRHSVMDNMNEAIADPVSNPHYKKRRINNGSSNITSCNVYSQPPAVLTNVAQVAGWDEQQALNIVSGESNHPTSLRYTNIQLNAERESSVLTGDHQNMNSYNYHAPLLVKLEARECLSDITLESEGDDDDLESSPKTSITSTETQKYPPPPPPPPPNLEYDTRNNGRIDVDKRSLPDLDSCDEFEASVNGGPFEFSNNSTTCGSKTVGVTPNLTHESHHYMQNYKLCRPPLTRFRANNEEELQIDMCSPSATISMDEPSLSAPPPPPPPPPYVTLPQPLPDDYLTFQSKPLSLHDSYLRHHQHHAYHSRSTPIATNVNVGTVPSPPNPYDR